MPSFDDLFFEARGGPVIYNGKRLVLADQFAVSNGDILNIKIEKTNSEWRQGISIDITGYCEMDGVIFKEKKGVMMLFWEDACPKEFSIKVFTKKGHVWIQNIWERVNNSSFDLTCNELPLREVVSIDYGHHGAAMIVEEIENGKRYRCNDGHPDENFDDIIFSIQKK
jgi:hypothetical protein